MRSVIKFVGKTVTRLVWDAVCFATVMFIGWILGSAIASSMVIK